MHITHMPLHHCLCNQNQGIIIITNIPLLLGHHQNLVHLASSDNCCNKLAKTNFKEHSAPETWSSKFSQMTASVSKPFSHLNVGFFFLAQIKTNNGSVVARLKYLYKNQLFLQQKYQSFGCQEFGSVSASYQDIKHKFVATKLVSSCLLLQHEFDCSRCSNFSHKATETLSSIFTEKHTNLSP